jgi:hypothetical protein
MLFRPESPLFEFLESCLRHKCEVVIYEAASAIVRMPKTTSRELAPAVSVLQLFCASPKPSLRFAAVRTLNKVSFHSFKVHQLLLSTPAYLNHYLIFHIYMKPIGDGLLPILLSWRSTSCFPGRCVCRWREIMSLLVQGRSGLLRCQYFYFG